MVGNQASNPWNGDRCGGAKARRYGYCESPTIDNMAGRGRAINPFAQCGF
jgi:hypothetical protein